MSVMCWWSGCDSTFASKSSLKRHIRSIHKNERSFVCSNADCDSTFFTSSDLKRHVLAVHIKERLYECKHCAKKFTTVSSLHRHEKIHGSQITISSDTVYIEKQTFICAECESKFSRKDGLVKHLFTQHFVGERLECHYCGCKFRSKDGIKRHIFARHYVNGCVVPVQKKNARCVLCDQSYQGTNQLREHYVEFHGVDLKTETLSFPSIKEFLDWKKKFEDSTIARFRIRVKTKKKWVYICHRSGYYTVKHSNRKRSPLLRGSKKLNGECPATITVCFNEHDSSCTATVNHTHLGHLSNDKNELKFHFLRKEDRERLAGRIASGVPKRQILDDQLEDCDTLLHDFTKADVVRIDLLKNKDLLNIETSFNMKCNENFVEPHDEDLKNFEEFINDFRESVLFYKQEGEPSPEEFSDCQLEESDFVLIFMCPSQEKMMKKHGNNIVCIDGTQDVNPYGFILHSLLVLDYDGDGFPAAFAFSNRDDETLIKIFLRCIKEKIGATLTPQTLMTDMQEYYFNAWTEEMGTPGVHVCSMWHIRQEWRKHLPKKNNKKGLPKTDKLKQDLYNLSIETNITTFHQKLEKFLSPSKDPKVNEFLKYFKEKYCNYEKWIGWSYAYRLSSGLSTNSHLESFYRTLEYVHAFGNTIKDLYSGLRTTVNYVKQKKIDFTAKVISGKITPRLVVLKEAHRLAENEQISILNTNENEWLVPSFRVQSTVCEEFHVVRKLRATCPAQEDEDIGTCYLICPECNECSHKYSCTCIENGIRSHMCKHIHAVVLSASAPHVLVEPQPSNSDGNFQTVDLVSRRMNLTKRFSDLIEKFETNEQFEMCERYLSHMEAAFLTSNMKDNLPIIHIQEFGSTQHVWLEDIIPSP